jgi:hypothetical protein
VKKNCSAVLILALALAACGETTTLPDRPGTPVVPTIDTRPATIAPSPSPVPRREPIVLTFQDGQGVQSVDLIVGNTFVLKLGDGYIWQVEISDERIVTRAPNPGAKSDARGPYLARGPGQTELQITGDPACSKASPPCAMPSILYEVKISVR